MGPATPPGSRHDIRSSDERCWCTGVDRGVAHAGSVPRGAQGLENVEKCSTISMASSLAFFFGAAAYCSLLRFLDDFFGTGGAWRPEGAPVGNGRLERAWGLPWRHCLLTEGWGGGLRSSVTGSPNGRRLCERSTSDGVVQAPKFRRQSRLCGIPRRPPPIPRDSRLVTSTVLFLRAPRRGGFQRSGCRSSPARLWKSKLRTLRHEKTRGRRKICNHFGIL